MRVRYAFDLASNVQREMYSALDGGTFYEPGTSRFLMHVLSAGDTFIDIGGHVGYFSMLAAARVGTNGDVITFEPSPGNFRQLVEHVALNGFTNVLPLHLALGASEHVAALHFNADNDGGHALWDVGLHPHNQLSRDNPRVDPVYTTRLDRVLCGRPLRSLKLMKLDIEGSEVLALEGARTTIERTRVPFIIAEVNRTALEQMGASESTLRSLMREMGYDTFIIQDAEPFLVALSDDMTVTNNYVFNLLFRRREASLPQL